MEKINIAELLKECPKGMELDCTIYSNVTFIGINKEVFPTIKVQTEEGVMHLTECGCYAKCETAKCVIFPKGKTTWEGFQRPFKDGDIITCTNRVGSFVSIYKEKASDTLFKSYAHTSLCKHPLFKINSDASDYFNPRFATKEEKEKLFQVIKDNGYKWNAETKTLEKLIEPKFKVGDTIVEKEGVFIPVLITSISDGVYYSKLSCSKAESTIQVLPISEQDKWELIPNKFSITSLKAFDKVLVRDRDNGIWRVSFYGFYRKESKYPFVCINQADTGYKQCIPFEGNEHLLGKTDDCDDYYKTWEE